jgi:hypothetical protein
MLAGGARYVCEARRVHSQMPDTTNSPLRQVRLRTLCR